MERCIITVATVWFASHSFLLITWYAHHIEQIEWSWFLIDGLPSSIFYLGTRCPNPSYWAGTCCSTSKWCGRRFVGIGYAKSWMIRISYMCVRCQFNIQFLPSLATKFRHRLNGMRWLGPAGEWTELPQTQEAGLIRGLSWPMWSSSPTPLYTDSFVSP